MPIIRVPEQAWEGVALDGFVPGARVEYQGAPWKVVGMYFAFASAPGPREGGPAMQSVVSERTKYLILQSLRLGPGALQRIGMARSS